MNKKKIMLSVAVVLASCTLAACGKVDGGIKDPVIPQNTRENTKTETTQSTANPTTEKETSINSDDGIYEWPSTPWIFHYPKDAKTLDDGAFVVAKDVTNYLVAANCLNPSTSRGEFWGTIEGTAARMVVSTIGISDNYCQPSLGCRLNLVEGSIVDGKYDVLGVNEVEGEYVDINGVNVYKFTAKVPTESGGWDCHVYGYTWEYLTPDVKDEKLGIYKYSGAGETQQYAIVGVVSAYDQDAYKADMEELTDYLMNSTQMLSD